MGDVTVDTTACGAPLLALVGGVRADDGPDSFDDLASYRVPEGTEAPEELTATVDYLDFNEWWIWADGFGSQNRGDVQVPEPHTGHKVTFRRATDLDAKLPPAYAKTAEISEGTGDIGPGVDVLGEGEKLISYVSDVVPGAVLGDIKLQTELSLPSGSRPYAGPFEHLSMAGWRVAMTKEMIPDDFLGGGVIVAQRLGLRGDDVDAIFAQVDPEREIDCRVGAAILASLAQGADGGLDRAMKRDPGEVTDLSFCPWPELPLVEDGDLQVDLDRAFAGTETATRDLDLRGSGETFVEQGNTATVPFSLVGAGPAGQKVDLTASISPAIPGLGDVTSEIDFPGAGTHGRSVEIKVPASAPARTYEILLTAAKGDHKRTTKAGLVVLPKPAAPAAAAAPPAPVNKPLTRDNIYVDGDGYIRFGALCGTCTVDVLVPFGTVGGAKTARASKPRLLRIARASMKGAKGTRKVVKVRLFPKARRAMRDGRTMTGLIVAREGKGAKPEVRRIIIRRKRSK